MITANINDADRRFLFLEGDKSDMASLEKHLNKIPKHMFLPSYSGVPKPEVFLHRFSRDGRTLFWCHFGLWYEVHQWCSMSGVKLNGADKMKACCARKFDISLEDFTKWVDSLELSKKLRDYQYAAAWKILKFNQSMSQIATRAGKTLIAYIIFRWMIEMEGAHNILMIVPSTQLVKQGVADMSEYKEFFKSETVWAKSELCDSSNLTIGTFQSLVNRLDRKNKNYNPKFFEKFDVVVVDECHKAKCKSIDTILQQPFMKNVKLRFGFSGSLPDKNTIEDFACQSLMGPMIQDIKTKELIDAGYLAKVDFEQIRIRYEDDDALKRLYLACGEYICSNYASSGSKELLPSSERRFLMQHKKVLPHALKIVKTQRSQQEYIDYLVDLCKGKGSNLLLLEQMVSFECEKRIRVIGDLLLSSDKNFIVFAHHKEYLKHMCDLFSKAMPHKKCMIITGSVSLKKRQQIIDTMEKNDNCILFASYACVGTGITFKNVDFGIFAESFKSKIINKQSVGRGLLLGPEKEYFKVYDIIDCFPTKRIEWQGNTKKKLFENEGFDVSVRYA